MTRIGWPKEADAQAYPPSARRFASLSKVTDVCWTAATITGERWVRGRLRGLTGTASCRLNGELLLYGGTLNGNAGPVFANLLSLTWDARLRTLGVRKARVRPTDATPKARRGHSLTATTIGDGRTAVGVVSKFPFDLAPLRCGSDILQRCIHAA